MLGEKPISNEIEKARQMVAKADQKGVYYGINPTTALCRRRPRPRSGWRKGGWATCCSST